jgi:TatA/E family protein of Tat protein translocase
MSIGPAEIIIVLVIALLVFGPSRLPQMGRSLGRGVREFKKAADTAKNELGLGEVTDSINDVKATFTEPLKDVTGTFGDLKASVDVKSAIEAPVQAAGAAGAATAAAGAVAQETAPAQPSRLGTPLGVVEEGPETPAVTPATVFADVTPTVPPEVPEAQTAVEAPEAPAVETAVEAAPDEAAVAVAEPAAPSES